MLLSNLIGSLLTFQRNGIGEHEIRIIAEHCNSRTTISVDENITQVYRHLNNFNDCFTLKNNRIVVTEYYYCNSSMLKKRFFDRLSDDEKKHIYAIVNLL